MEYVKIGTDDRIFAIAGCSEWGNQFPISGIRHALTVSFFLDKMKKIIDMEKNETVYR